MINRITNLFFLIFDIDAFTNSIHWYVEYLFSIYLNLPLHSFFCFDRTTAPALVTGSEDGVLRVLKVLVNETSKHISGIEMVFNGFYIFGINGLALCFLYVLFVHSLHSVISSPCNSFIFNCIVIFIHWIGMQRWYDNFHSEAVLAQQDAHFHNSCQSVVEVV